jgi:hypothetical protein
LGEGGEEAGREVVKRVVPIFVHIRRHNRGPTRRTLAILAFATLIASVYNAPSLPAQVIEIREYRGKQITCVSSPKMSFATPCGADDRYAYIFVGSVMSTTEISETEKLLQVLPEEVFLGHTTGVLAISTNQGACLPDISAGDKWLFYLREEKTDTPVLAYGSPSKTVADAQEDIALLRRISKMTNSGLLTGNVNRAVWNDNEMEPSAPLPGIRLTAHRISDSSEFTASIDGEGHYEFPPVPSGSYNLTAEAPQGLWTEQGGPTKVRPRSCTNVGFEMAPDGRISGHVKTTDGKPAKQLQVAIVPVSPGNLGFTSSIADEQGYFEVKGLHPGSYLVGVGIQSLPESREWKSRVYYPGVQSRDAAVIIELGQAEKRTNVDFWLPNGRIP